MAARKEWLLAFSGYARHPTVLGTVHHNNYPDPNVGSVKEEELYDTGNRLSQGKEHRQKNLWFEPSLCLLNSVTLGKLPELCKP